MVHPAGTRVVLRTPIAGARGVVPGGSVAAIVSGPDALERYRVRFPNGHETDLAPGEFELLARYEASSETSAIDEQLLRKEIIYRCVIGSRAYGLETDASDVDYRGIYQAPTELVLSLFDAPAQIVDDEAQECFWELKKFLLLALKSNPAVIEVLYSPLVEEITPIGEELLVMRRGFLSKLIYQTFNGYAISQFQKMERSRTRDAGPNWKHAQHLIRLLELGIRIVETGEPQLQTEHREALLEIRSGAWTWERVEAWRTQLHARFEKAYRGTDLPERPDAAAANDLLIRARRAAMESS